MTDHEHCWHMFEVLTSNPAQVRERCCWCDDKRTITYQPPETEHGRFIYR